ncbi:MAG: hypothetical protein HYY24_28840 [Verrucomicrobia bacterium]|nr:hypothetical protein [Verrucomicrobiota bacterium]
MRIRLRTKTEPTAAYALALVLVFTGLSLMALAGVLDWTSTNAAMTARSNQYFSSAAAAEAATEKVLAQLALDYRNGGEAAVYANLGSYRSQVPTTAENGEWGRYEFSNGTGGAGSLYVDRLTSESYVELNSQYRGLRGWASTYRILANARDRNSGFAITAAVDQDVQVASIPIFQFAIFYGLDLEINTMTPMVVNGRVHGNATIYTYPSASLAFRSDVTSVGKIITTRKPGDPDYSTAPPAGTITYMGDKATGVSSLTLPIGTSNSPAAIRQILDMPPSTESVSSPMGRQRYYNKAELLILVNNTGVTVAAKSPFAVGSNSIPWIQASNFISTTKTFTDQREGKTIKVTEIDVSKIQAWSLANSAVRAAIGSGKPVNLIYVADNRTTTSSQMTAVRLINGQNLPTRGLTVATPNPLYVKGHFNQLATAFLGTTNTINTRPASLVSDALTILSPSWLDSKSSSSYTTRTASDTTVNAAILTGIVETTNSPARYSGGVHNLGRFLENWNGRTFTCNGSMVVLFPSTKATKPFQQPGAYYYPPARNYSFDLNFTDITKVPPGTPEVRAMIRSAWVMAKPNTTAVGPVYY